MNELYKTVENASKEEEAELLRSVQEDVRNNGIISDDKIQIIEFLKVGPSSKTRRIGKLLEKTYKQALERYNSQIAKVDENIEVARDMFDKAQAKLEEAKQKLITAKQCKEAGMLWTTVKGGQKRCVDKHYKSRVKCRSKKRKGYIFSKKLKKCVRSGKKRSALCRKQGLVYDKDTGKCRKSGVKSRARTAAQWKEHCTSQGKHLGKRNGKYVCRKSPAKKSRSLTSRRKKCMSKKGRTFAKNKDGQWRCRKSKKGGRRKSKK